MVVKVRISSFIFFLLGSDVFVILDQLVNRLE